jgi:hypothetical protein
MLAVFLLGVFIPRKECIYNSFYFTIIVYFSAIPRSFIGLRYLSVLLGRFYGCLQNSPVFVPEIGKALLRAHGIERRVLLVSVVALDIPSVRGLPSMWSLLSMRGRLMAAALSAL